MKQLFLILATTLSGFLSHACLCEKMSFTEEVSTADQIFIGTVMRQTLSNQAYYSFNISKTFKGSKMDSLTIETGFGGGDCGMFFETGKTYIVYAVNFKTTGCNRNALLDQSHDLEKLQYLFQDGYAALIGKNNDPQLTEAEANYLNEDLFSQRKQFDCHGKEIAFLFNDSIIGKQKYLSAFGGKDAPATLIILTKEEQQKVHYDAIVVIPESRSTRKKYRKSVLEKFEQNRRIGNN